MMKKAMMAVLVLFSGLAMAMSITKLNSASKEELMQIKGIGEKKAAAIIKERKKGKFKSFGDLTERVDGIGEQTAANIKSGVKSGEASAKVHKSTKKGTKKKMKKTKSEAKNKTKSLNDKKKKAKKAEKTLKKKKEKIKKNKKTKTAKKSKKAA
jgi:competence protein ComEA